MVDILRNMVVWTSRTPASSRTPDLPPLEPSPKAIAAEVAGLPARLQNAWFAALPVDRFPRARGILSAVSSSVRRQRAMLDSLRVMHYDLSTERQLEDRQRLIRDGRRTADQGCKVSYHVVCSPRKWAARIRENGLHEFGLDGHVRSRRPHDAWNQ